MKLCLAEIFQQSREWKTATVEKCAKIFEAHQIKGRQAYEGA